MPADDRISLNVLTGTRRYEIVIATGAMASCGGTISEWHSSRYPASDGSRKGLIVTDTNVREPHAVRVAQSLTDAGWMVEVETVPAGEESKRLGMLETLLSRLAEMKADRRTLVVAVGGGVIGDLAGFAAATYARGIPFVQVPTTLLADVDSSVGGKVGINLPQGKNLVGAFHQPIGVFIDTDAIASLPRRDYIAGLAEVVKYGMILDAAFFERLEAQAEAVLDRRPVELREVIAHCCRLKGEVVDQDEFELTGLRAKLNYGHTFGHAFESLAGYGTLLHGEGVSIGMCFAVLLAEKLGHVTSDVRERQRRLLAAFDLPTRLPPGTDWPTEQLLERMRLDKKTVGDKLRFVLPTRIGEVRTVRDVPESLVREVLEEPSLR